MFWEYDGRVAAHVTSPAKGATVFTGGCPALFKKKREKKKTPRDYTVPDVYLGVLILSTPSLPKVWKHMRR